MVACHLRTVCGGTCACTPVHLLLPVPLLWPSTAVLPLPSPMRTGNACVCLGNVFPFQWIVLLGATETTATCHSLSPSGDCPHHTQSSTRARGQHLAERLRQYGVVASVTHWPSTATLLVRLALLFTLSYRLLLRSIFNRCSPFALWPVVSPLDHAVCCRSPNSSTKPNARAFSHGSLTLLPPPFSCIRNSPSDSLNDPGLVISFTHYCSLPSLSPSLPISN